jgi:hypothetical protein
MLFVELMTGTPLLKRGGPVSIAAAHTVTSQPVVDVSKLSAAIDGYRLAIHGNLEFTGTVLAADPVSVRVSHFKGVRSPDSVRSLIHSATACRLVSDQSTSAILEYRTSAILEYL